MRLVFAGTPELARVILDALIASAHQVVGAMTQPDKAVGRHRTHATPPPVKVRAQEAGIPVLQPERLRDPEVAAWLGGLAPDAVAVAAYGKIVPAELLALPPRGFVNVHASLLPRWRGAAPIQHAILAADAETGVCIMRMDEGMDTGAVWAREATAIGPRESAGALSERLAEMGGRLLVETLDAMESGDLVEAEPQPETGMTLAPKLSAQDVAVDWTLPADALDRRIRAADPKPGAVAQTVDGPLKVWRARPVEYEGAPGWVMESEPDLIVSCGRGALALVEVQAAGGQRMSGQAWARGRRLKTGGRIA
jgi:methionyl-tRNA formyltransferase